MSRIKSLVLLSLLVVMPTAMACVGFVFKSLGDVWR